MLQAEIETEKNKTQPISLWQTTDMMTSVFPYLVITGGGRGVAAWVWFSQRPRCRRSHVPVQGLTCHPEADQQTSDSLHHCSFVFFCYKIRLCLLWSQYTHLYYSVSYSNNKLFWKTDLEHYVPASLSVFVCMCVCVCVCVCVLL